MYTAFFGLREKPFALSPDPRFLFLSASHREALAHLLYGIEQGEGFIAVTGEVGTGKTTLCRTLLERSAANRGRVPLQSEALGRRAARGDLRRARRCSRQGRTRASWSDALNQFLVEKNASRPARAADRRRGAEPAPETLEQIRLLSNLETDDPKLIQILLLGQPELDDEARVARPAPAAPAHQRALAASAALARRRRATTCATGCASRRRAHHIFGDAALGEVYRCSGGIPRLVNLLCDRALLAGYAAGEKRVGPDLIGVAAREILGARRRLLRRRPWLRRTYVAGAALVLLASGALAWQQWTHVEPRVVVESTPSVSTPPVGAAGVHAVEPAAAPPPFIGPPQAVESRDAG